jgi:hypothetical protein
MAGDLAGCRSCGSLEENAGAPLWGPVLRVVLCSRTVGSTSQPANQRQRPQHSLVVSYTRKPLLNFPSMCLLTDLGTPPPPPNPLLLPTTADCLMRLVSPAAQLAILRRISSSSSSTAKGRQVVDLELASCSFLTSRCGTCGCSKCWFRRRWFTRQAALPHCTFTLFSVTDSDLSRLRFATPSPLSSIFFPYFILIQRAMFTASSAFLAL